MELSYEYFLIVIVNEDDDDVDHIISCNEVTLHQAFVDDFCPSDEDELQAKTKSPKEKEGKDSIVVSISSLPNDSVDDSMSCPDSIQLRDNESCRVVTGGLKFELNFSIASGRRRLSSGSDAVKEDIGMSSGSAGSEPIKKIKMEPCCRGCNNNSRKNAKHLREC